MSFFEKMVAHQGEVKIPMDVGTLVDTRSARMEALIDDAGSKQPCAEVGGLLLWFRPTWFERYTCWGKSPWPIFSPVAARHQCCGRIASRVDSGRFSVLDEDLGDTEVDESGDTADFRTELRRRSTVSRRRLVLVSQQEVAPTMMDAPSAISRDLHGESNVESIRIDFEDTASLSGNATLDQDDSILIVEPLGSLSCRGSCSDEFL